MAGAAAGVLVLLLAIAAAPAYATDYTVGDSQGWTQGVDYSTWANDKTFNVGDSLVFQYGFLHSVDEVGKSDYDACSSSNSLQSYTDQNTKITLTAPGPRYFICGTSGHCTAGMKLAVTAVAGSTPATPSTPTTPSDGSTTTPSTASVTPTVPTGSTPSRTSPSTNVNAADAAGGYGGKAMVVGVLGLAVALLG